MSEKKKTTLSDVLIPLAILWAIFHYFAAGYLAPMSYQECRDKNIAFNQKFCSCAKSKLRLSPYFESFIFASITDNQEMARQISQGVYSIKRACKEK